MGSERGLRMTPQRRVILKVLRDSENHPTADEVYERVRERLPRVSLGTVYRNLKTLADAGLIQRLTLTGAQARFDGKASRHLHIRCSGCGAVSDVPDDLVSIPEYPERLAGHVVLDHEMELIGLCPACQGTSERSEKGEDV